MTASRSTTTATAEIVSRLEDVTRRLEALTDELKAVRITQATEYTQLASSGDENRRRIVQHDSDIKDLRTSLTRLEREVEKICQTTKILLGVLSFIGLTTGGWLLGRLLGLIAP